MHAFACAQVSVHAAVCVWGSARLLAMELAGEAHKARALALADNPVRAELLWTRPLRLAAGQLGHRHKSVRSVLTMAHKCELLRQRQPGG